MTAMTADQSARRLRSAWRAARSAARAMRAAQDQQMRMWEAWLQANRVAVPETGPLKWVLTLDGYRLAGRHLPTPGDTTGGDTA